MRFQVINHPFSITLDVKGHKRPEEGLFPYLEGVQKITGLQYGLVPLYEAGRIALQQLQTYIERTGKQTQICLADIEYALNIVALNLKGMKRDYVMSAATALKLLLGPNDLFATRGGVPLQELVNGNYILPCHKLSTIQCRFLAFCLLSYLLMASYDHLESTHLKSLVVIDDSSAFINRPENIFGTTVNTSFWGPILSKLRGSGRGLLFADQLVGSVFEDVKALCSNWMIVGGLRDTKNFAEIKAAMNLTDEQADYIGKMKERECIAFFPTHYPRPVLGTIPEVSSIDEGSINA